MTREEQYKYKLLRPKFIERFWAKVDKQGPNECWNWKGDLTKKGYGRHPVTIEKYKQKKFKAHRLALFFTIGIGAKNKPFVCHHCNNPSCCNPSHLYWGDNSDNIIDAYNAGTMKPGPGGKRKLAPEQERQIKKEYEKGDITKQALAFKYNVGKTTIINIIRRII